MNSLSITINYYQLLSIAIDFENVPFLSQVALVLKFKKTVTLLEDMELVNINDMEPKRHIEEITKDHSRSSERTLDGYAGSIETLEKAFTRRSHFIMEFIQNADYAKSNTLMTEIFDDKIVIYNDGYPFTPEDVESICKVGRSSKGMEGYIGYLGVGFKSIFLVSNNPQIYSRKYCFEFNKNHWPDSNRLPWQVMPIWIGKNEDTSKRLEKWGSIFTVPFKDLRIADSLRNEIIHERLTPKVLLFLENLKEIIIDNGKGYVRNIHKRDYGNKIYTIFDKDNNSSSLEKWKVFSKVCSVPSSVRIDAVTAHWKRDTVKQREIIVAFKLTEEGELDSNVDGTAHVGAFSYTPLKEESNIGIKFLIQADFLMGPGREIIDREALWNKWLLDQGLSLVIEECVLEFKKHDKWKWNFTNILYPGESGHELFDEHIKKPLRKYLEDNPVLIAENGSYVKPTDAISVESEIRDLISEKDLQAFYPNKKVLHPDCQTNIKVDEISSNLYTFITENIGKQLILNKAKSGDVQWFKKLYKKLNNNYSIDRLVNESIILTNKNGVVSARNLYIKPEKISLPSEVDIEFVHPKLTEDTDILDFLKSLRIKELTEKDIQDILKINELPRMIKNWEKMSDSEKVDNIKVCKGWWENNRVEIQTLSFITLKTKSGKWLSPNEIIFSKDYNPSDQNIEELKVKGLLDLHIELLSGEFISDRNNEEIRGWRNFFEELGVDKRLYEDESKTNIVQRIAINLALHYETKEDREARPLAESEKSRGFDIESKSPNEVRFIEVKGRKDTNPDIPLTENQANTITDEKDNYFVYLVTDALRFPCLHIIKGYKLLKTQWKFITIRPREWKQVVEDRFPFPL